MAIGLHRGRAPSSLRQCHPGKRFRCLIAGRETVHGIRLRRTAYQSEQSSILAAPSRQHASQTEFGPCAPSSRQQPPPRSSGISRVPWMSPGARTNAPVVPWDKARTGAKMSHAPASRSSVSSHIRQAVIPRRQGPSNTSRLLEHRKPGGISIDLPSVKGKGDQDNGPVNSASHPAQMKTSKDPPRRRKRNQLTLSAGASCASGGCWPLPYGEPSATAC